MRAILVLVLAVLCLAAPARAQLPLDAGSPESAFAGGPIRLSKNAAGVLRAHYQGDRVPLIPQPFRGKLDNALLGRDWPRVEAEKNQLTAARGIVTTLAWEQSRFIATGAVGLAEMHALDVAATGSTGLSETAVMMWFYAVAVTMTDGHKCADPAAKDAHLERLRGYAFEPVNRLVRSISDDRLVAMRDLAIRLETVLAVDRTDDSMCLEGAKKADIRPDPVWRPEAALTRAMLPRHLTALAAVMRPKPVARREPPKPEPEPARPAVGTTAPAIITPYVTETGKSELAKPEAVTAKPAEGETPNPDREPTSTGPATQDRARPDTSKTEPAKTEPASTAPMEPDKARATPAEPRPPETATAQPTQPEPVQPGLANPNPGKPDPARFEPPNLELTAPDPAAKP